MYYAFHIIEARASFDKATRFDEKCAMAWWGKALAFGPNINDFIYQRPAEAFPSALKANELKQGCTKPEQALIEAIAVRYAADSAASQDSLNILYKNAMKEVYKSYMDNAEVNALYADALMMLHPWDLYNLNYTAKKWTPEIVAVIKHALQLYPTHPGANHYYIHAIEASSHPEQALKSADFLATSMPDVSHVTHMPSHIYIRTGYYDKGVRVNDKAIDGFNKYSTLFPAVTENLPLYSLHNTYLKLNCAQMAGNYAVAMDASKKLQQETPAMYLSFPGAIGNIMSYAYEAPLLTQVRFGKWDDILNGAKADTGKNIRIIQHFGRGIAFAKTKQFVKASEELARLKSRMQEPSLKEPLTPFNSAFEIYLVAESILAGTIAEEQKDFKSAITHFRKAVIAEDTLIYTEPRDWLIPARQYLGNALIKAGNYAAAIEVLNQDLTINPNNGWALTGIVKAYEKMKNTAAIVTAKNRLKIAWQTRDVPVEAPVF
jgi:tetratricopeptide (TPR) repeat protein